MVEAYAYLTVRDVADLVEDSPAGGRAPVREAWLDFNRFAGLIPTSLASLCLFKGRFSLLVELADADRRCKEVGVVRLITGSPTSWQ